MNGVLSNSFTIIPILFFPSFRSVTGVQSYYDFFNDSANVVHIRNAYLYSMYHHTIFLVHIYASPFDNIVVGGEVLIVKMYFVCCTTVLYCSYTVMTLFPVVSR